MWANERKWTIIRNVIAGLALIAVIFGLVKTINAVKQQIAAEDALLREQHSSQRQEMNEARQENQALIQQTYQQHQETLAQYLPGIVCWGDSLTAGTSGNVSYPQILQELIDTNLCNRYDLRYAFTSTDVIARINPKDYRISIPVVNMGSGQENTATILGRAGVLPYVVQRNFVIPAETESVAIYLESQDGRPVTPLMAGNAGVNPVVIAGVAGNIARVYKNNTFVYEFTRLEAGEAVAVDKKTEILTAADKEYQDYIHIVWLGTYDNGSNPEKLLKDTKALLERQELNGERFLVIGPCATNGTWSTQSMRTLDAIDSAMTQEFGNQYVSLRKYLISDGLRDAGLTATKADNDNIKRGAVPESFRSSATGADLNAVGYELVANLVYGRMEQLGYFDEIRTELNLP